MTGYDERHGIMRQRLGNLARQHAVAELRGDLSVREHATRRNAAGNRVDAAGELGNAIEIDRYGAEILSLAGEQADDIDNGTRDIGRRRGFARIRKATRYPGTRRTLALFRKLHPGNAAAAPHDAAIANRGRKQVKAEIAHDPYLITEVTPVHPKAATVPQSALRGFLIRFQGNAQRFWNRPRPAA